MRKLRKLWVPLFLAAMVLIFGYARYVEPELLIVREITVETDMDIAGLHGLCKSIELEYGRDMTSRLHNRVPLDIDIVIADGEILRPRDYAQEYFQSGYTEIISGSGS